MTLDDASPTSSDIPPTASSSAFPKPTVFLPPSASAPSPLSSRIAPATLTPPLPSPEDEPKPTLSELQAAFASTIQNNKRAGAGPDAPLMTQAMRDKHEAKFSGAGAGKKTFEEIHIRFRFSDRTILEYKLPSSTPLPYLYPLLRSALLSSHSATPFTLYTSPPKIEFPEEAILGPPLTPAQPGRPKSLAAKKPGVEFRGKKIGEMGWGGGVIVSVRWNGPTKEEAEKLNSSSCPAPISGALRGQGRELEAPNMGQTQQASGNAAGGPDQPATGQKAGGASSGEGKEKKVPKWFKGIGASAKK